MKKFIIFILTIAILALVFFETIVMGVLYQKKDTYYTSYQNVIVDKYRYLESTDQNKIIMIAGSSSAFGLDQNFLESQTGYKVVNLGLHAGFGQLFLTELAKENINEGDIVLLGYEYNWIDNFENLDQELVMTGIDANIDMYKHIPMRLWPDFIGYMFKYAANKNSYEGTTGIYSRDAFDQSTGQMIWRRDHAMSDYYDKVESYGNISVLDEDGVVSISDNSVAYLKDLKTYVEERGAKIYFVSPPHII